MNVFFTEQERGIYTSPGGKKFDPLRVLHHLTVVTSSHLSELVVLRNPGTLSTGDISKSGRVQAKIEAASAELQLADAARKVFGYGTFEESGVGDAMVLETLYHFLDYLEGKGSQAPTPRPSEEVFPVVSSHEPTTSL